MNFHQKQEYDAIVVGSGMSGGWAMMELCRLGLKTLVVERGRMVRHIEDYITEDKEQWELPQRGEVPPAVVREHYPIQDKTYVFSEATRHFFMRDSEHPYVQEEPYTWIQADVFGGRSLMWARQSYRLSPMDFLANLEDGNGVDWPIRYEDIAPWYDYVERTIGVSGQAEGLPQLPDGIFQKPMEMNAVELMFKKSVESTFPERTVTIGRTATLTEPLGNRAACQYCGACERGCSTSSYYSTVSVAFPIARATGNLTVQTDSLVCQVNYDETTGRATGVDTIDMNTGERRTYHGKMIFLCASSMNTARIMLLSSSRSFPDGIANSSGTLGHYLMDHHYHVGARGSFEGYQDRYYMGRRPNGIYIPRFRNLGPETHHPSFLRGYGFQGSASRVGWGRAYGMSGFGAEFKHSLRTPAEWRMGLGGFAETLPRYDNYCTLDESIRDSWGLSVLRFHVTRDDNDRAMRKDIMETAAEMLEASGFINVEAYDTVESAPGLGNHEMGAARMGRDPETSVLNAFNQCHDVRNLFVTDGACMTSSACQNPSLTYMALTARACDYAVRQFNDGLI
ncbi:MAG: GMC family oxidoreductase [Bacteroidetes bacterium]|nr:GMC family oxidoreductase [Bacteroidota bacterium]MCY4204101.1 GMC family oxidoreductase [Bacteroidota bacterium]